MSKNVAIFVDVANIFYAAKAAGVDIDYVTLLKAATSGRDLVRAYAYTGLDPENDNQRQFHAFLARNGYKVISKDIRKYGDGRIKANLDIELVVDMMKTARNLDIAIVVSGDGDFASAIRAVQEMGVRVEVISFRGNTSSDLIEVADLFTDIAHIARVDKNGRSGRRVAVDGDLSMTEVPEKVTEGAPRRRRTRTTPSRDERPLEPVVAVEHATNVVMLPGERLSRAGEGDEPESDEHDEAAVSDVADVAAVADPADVPDVAADGADDTSEEGRRRRRRRGGRGRGRGRRPEDEAVQASTESVQASSAETDAQPDVEEEYEPLPTAQPPVHAFGSVWDSQLGVPTTTPLQTVDLGGSDIEADEDYEEPEVPEYLLAERRQAGGQRPAGRGRPAPRHRAAYQQALDREIYGRGASQPTYSQSRPPAAQQQQSPGRGRQGRPPAAQQPQRGPRPSDRQRSEPRPSSSGDPWSEVPPELEQMLRAEMARKQPAARAAAPSTVEVDEIVAQPVEVIELAPETAAPKPVRKPRTTRKPAAETSAQAPAQASGESAAPEAAAEPHEAQPAPKPVRKPRTTKPGTAKAAPGTDSEPAAAEAPKEAAPKTPVKRTTRARTTKSAAPTEEG